MGLRERRAAKAFEDNTYPALKARIDAAYGKELPVEVDWKSLAIDGSAHLYEEGFTQVYFETLIGALEGIAIDDMGREALHEGLEKVVITNSGNHSSYRGFSFADGVLTIDHEPTSNMHQVQERIDGTVTMLEDAL